MRLSVPSGSTRVGNVELYETFRVTELDAGCPDEAHHSKAANSCRPESTIHGLDVVFSPNILRAIESQMAIIIPCMNEEAHLLEGVLRGIPNTCLIILVSNSSNSTSDDANFQVERRLLTQVCHENKRFGVVVHQQDEGLAGAFAAAGMSKLVQETYRTQSRRKAALRVRKGKGEAMMIGVALAKLAGKQFVGFIDADNWVPGSVQEYCKVYAAGLHYALHDQDSNKIATTIGTTQSAPESHAMVRIKWNQKPKVEDGKLVSKDSGRCSIVVNQWMNRLLNAITNNVTGTEMIQTGNAGEHAMSIDLALQLHFATGYAVEPFQFIDAWEQFGLQDLFSRPLPKTMGMEKPYIARGIPAPVLDTAKHRRRTTLTTASVTPLLPKVKILQIKTCNPHIHDFSKGDGHIEGMQIQGLNTVYHSRLAPQKLKDELRMFMKEKFPAALGVNGEPDRTLVYPPLRIMKWGVFRSELTFNAKTFEVFGDAENVLA